MDAVTNAAEATSAISSSVHVRVTVTPQRDDAQNVVWTGLHAASTGFACFPVDRDEGRLVVIVEGQMESHVISRSRQASTGAQAFAAVLPVADGEPERLAKAFSARHRRRTWLVVR